MSEPDDRTENHAPPDDPDGLPTTDQGPPSAIGPGSTLPGGRRVIRKLGGGGMGDVWLVRLDDLGCERAVKRIGQAVANDPKARARFRAEARTLASISHPNVVVLHDASFGGGGPEAYLEMEYVPGRPLDRLMEPGSALPLDWIARVVGQLCDALGAIHARGVVHRDLKPSNLMLLDGRPPGREWLKVLDFGIAKVLQGGAGPGEGTLTGGFIGTYPYAAPEQVCGAAGVASDLYATGVLLHEMATGRRPFSGPMAKVLHDHVHTPPPPISSIRPDLAFPPGFEALVLRCLAKEPADRPASAAELAEALEAALRPGPAEVPETAAFPRSDPTPRRRRWAPAASMAVVATSALWAVAARHSRDAHGPPALAIARPALPAPRPVEAPEPAETPPDPGPGRPAEVEVEPPAGPSPAAPASLGPLTPPTPASPGPVPTPAPVPEAPRASPPPLPKPAPVRPATPPARPRVAPTSPPSLLRDTLGVALGRVPDASSASGCFYLGVHEVTQGVYRAVVGTNPSVLADSDDHPVTNVSWLDALAFCNALSLREGLRPAYRVAGPGAVRLAGDGYRLPTEAEWRLARARGGAVAGDLAALGRVAWFRENSRTPGTFDHEPVPHAVGLKRPDGLGRFDLLGNVAEWCWDPAPGGDSRRRAVLGGSFEDPAGALGRALPGGEPWDVRDLRIGFRVARDAPAVVERPREP